MATLPRLPGRYSAHARPVTGHGCPGSRAGEHAGYFGPPEGHFISRIPSASRPSPETSVLGRECAGCPGGLSLKHLSVARVRQPQLPQYCISFPVLSINNFSHTTCNRHLMFLGLANVSRRES
jgi:hypothetical protein